RGLERRTALRARPGRRSRRLRRLLPPPRRARGLRTPARSRRDDARPAADVDEHARGRRRAGRRRDRCDTARRTQMTDAFRLDGKPSITAAGTDMRSYYGRPIIKEPVWTWEVPAYFFSGGLAGASSVLSSAARLAGNDKLARTSLYVGAVA